MSTGTDTRTEQADPAVARAELAKLEAEAAKAAADARAAETAAAKAAREETEATAPSAVQQREATADKEAADARAAETAAAKAAREETEATAPSAVRQRQATADKEAAEARKDAAAARQQQLAALMPDLSKVERGSLDVKGDEALFGQALAHRALTRAAETIAGKVAEGTDVQRVLVTSDTALAAADAAYYDVTSAMEQLVEMANATLEQTKPETTAIRKYSVTAAAAAMAGALPAVLSLFSARRTVATGTVAIDDVAASAAVAGALKGKDQQLVVRHNDFRLVPKGAISKQMSNLLVARKDLVTRKFELEARRTSTELDRTATSGQVAKLVEKIGDNGNVTAELSGLRQTLDEKTMAHDEASADADIVSSCIEDIDKFLTDVRAVPQDGGLSPLAAAALHEGLHEGADNQKFSHVLLVKARSGGTGQTVDDRPLWFKDRFSVIATVTVTYMLLSVPASDVVKAGNVTETVTGKGKIGAELTLDP